MEAKRLNDIITTINKYHLVKDPSPKNLREALEELGPTYIKIGQIMSSRPDLMPKEYCEELKKLRSNVKPVSYDEVIKILDKEYHNHTWDYFKEISKIPIGSASIAQTHKAILKTGEEVVIKIERENIYDIMTQDIKVLKSAVHLFKLDKIFSNVLDIDAFLDEMYNTALEEMNFMLEASHMKEFSSNQKDIKYIKPIKVYDEFCTKEALVMEYIGGFNINDLPALKANGYDINEISSKLANNYIKQALDDGFFHADPHSANIKICDGKIVFLDFGMMGRLSGRNRNLLISCISAILNDNYSEVAHILNILNTNNKPVDYMHLKADIKQVLDKNKTTELKDINIKSFAMDMFTMLNKEKIILPRDISMLLRGIVVIAGLLEEISPEISLMEVLKNYFPPEDLITTDSVKKYATSLVKSSADLMLIPKELLQTLKGINTGELRFNMEMTDSNGQISKIEELFHLGIITTLDVAFIIGISLMTLSNKTHEFLFTFYILGAVICTIWLFYKMILSKLRRK